MSRILPSTTLLRAFAAPCAAVCRCARYTTAAPTTPPASSAGRAADLAAVEAVTESDSAQPGAPDPLRPAHIAPSKSSTLKAAARAAKTVPFTPATQPQFPQSPPRYHVARSKSKNLPIYTDYKRGGNLHLTTVRKVTGDSNALRDELRAWLSKKDEHVTVNPLTQHVVVKGHHKEKLVDFLSKRGM